MNTLVTTTTKIAIFQGEMVDVNRTSLCKKTGPNRWLVDNGKVKKLT
jgi:hypothetical protein